MEELRNYTEDAKRLRPIIEEASKSLPDSEASEALELFPKWSGDGVAYAVGDRVQYMDMLFKCLQAHTSQPDWTPTAAVSLWTRVDDPSVEWPEWRQPTGAHDAYEQGAKVSHNDKHWTSDISANVWEPGVYGWTQAE